MPEPLGIDQSLWASAVRGMARGQLLYRDVWEQRPPGIYLTYLTGFHLFGWAASTVVWLDILASAATTVLLYGVTRPLSGTLAAAAAAALYAALTIPSGLYGHGGFLERSVSETFIIVCVSAGAFCAVRFRQTGALAAAFGAGLCSGAAVVFKPNAGLYLPALLVWMFLYTPKPAAAASQRAWFVRPLVAAAFGAAVAPALTVFWLWRIGVLGDAGIAVIDFNRFYVAQGFSAGSYAIDFSKAVWLRIKTIPLWVGGAIAAMFAVWELVRARRLSPLAGLAVAWGAAATLVIVVNGARLFNSYFSQAMPPLAVLVAWWLTDALRGATSRRLLALATGCLMLAVAFRGYYVSKILEWGRADLEMLRGRVDATAYLDRFGGYGNGRGYSARGNAELAAYVREHTHPDERIFLFGIGGAGVYFAADRLTAHRFLRVNFFVATDFPDPSFRLGPVVDDLTRTRPRYIIFERLHSTSEMAREVDGLPRHPEVSRLLTSYRLEKQIEDFSLYRRLD